MVVGCVSTTTTTTSTTTTLAASSTTTIPASGGPLPFCLAGSEPFIGAGSVGILGGAATDSDSVSHITWAVHEECERLVIHFNSAGGAPALDPPSASALMMRNSGVLRITFENTIVRSAISDQLIGTRLVDEAFVVRALDGTMFIDLHLASPVQARVSSSGSPATLTIDLQSGGAAYPLDPQVSRDLVVVEPTSGVVTYPFSMLGYAKTSDSISATLTGSAGEQTRASTPLAPGDDAWKGFALLFPLGPTGDIRVDFGDGSQLQLTAES